MNFPFPKNEYNFILTVIIDWKCRASTNQHNSCHQKFHLELNFNQNQLCQNFGDKSIYIQVFIDVYEIFH